MACFHGQTLMCGKTSEALSLQSTLYRILEILCAFQSNVVPQVAIVSATLG
jgi:hypothetical protein